MSRIFAIALFSLLITSKPLFAARLREPCQLQSRQMTLAKNCYTGEMVRPTEGGAQFFGAIEGHNKEVNYCYNSLILLEQPPTDPNVHIRVMKESNKGYFQTILYTLPRTALLQSKQDDPTLSLKGLKGLCFSSNPAACTDSFLKVIGWNDRHMPLILAVGKSTTGNYTVSHVIADEVDIKNANSIVVTPSKSADAAYATSLLIQDIRKKLIIMARLKLNAMRAGTSAANLASASEQFRYCSMALEGFLKDKQIPEPFSPEEKMTLATLTNYMNGTSAIQTSSRMPTSNKRSRAKN